MCQHFLAGGEVLLIFSYLKQTEFFSGIIICYKQQFFNGKVY